MRSASRCTGAFEPCASSTSRAICAERGVVADPGGLDDQPARRCSASAPNTASPGATSTGTGSPVSIDTSTADAPSTTVPSVAIFSPGRTTKRSPTRRLADRDLVAVLEARGLRAELEQRAERVARAAACPGLEVLPEEQQRDDRGRGLEVDVRAVAGAAEHRAHAHALLAARRGTRARPPTTRRRRWCRATRACPSWSRRGAGSPAWRGGTATPTRGSPASTARTRPTASPRTAARAPSRSATTGIAEADRDHEARPEVAPARRPRGRPGCRVGHRVPEVGDRGRERRRAGDRRGRR